MKEARYVIKLDASEEAAEKILEEIDLFLIELEHKYPMMQAEA
jgi:hypothetical protein